MTTWPAIVLVLAAAAAQAQGVWRCGPDGRSYSDRPCSDGRALEMAALADTRSTADVQAAREVAVRERRLADALRRERLDRERQALPPARVAQAKSRAAVRQRLTPKPPAQEASRVARVPAPAGGKTSPSAAPSSRRTKD